jgi:colicin import membrane protein
MGEDNSYKISLVCAITLHLMLIFFLCLKFSPSIEQPVLQQNVNIVKAFSISQKTVDQYFSQLAAEKQQAQQAAEQARLQQQQQLEQKLAEERKAQLEQKLKQQMLAEQAKEAEIIKKQQKELEAKQEQKKLQDSLQKQLAQEERQLKQQTKTADVSNKSNESSKKESSPQASGVIDKYKALIIQAISQEWIVPEDVDPSATCKILVKVAPGGIVLSAAITQSSGNELLDRSAQTAVLKASPLPVPKDGALFDSFRTIQLTVHPQEIVSG